MFDTGTFNDYLPVCRRTTRTLYVNWLMGDLTRNFSASEFSCPCCGLSNMNPEFMDRLQSLRDEWGFPFSTVPGGGYRCADYNGSETGAHVEGRAMDVDIPRAGYHEFVSMALRHGFTGIGVKNKRDDNGEARFQLHIDDAEELPGKRPRPWLWTY